MIPAEFDYIAPDTLEDAVRALGEGGEDAKLLAGGHSLIPLMKLRLATPPLLVDLRRVSGIHGIQREDGHWRIGLTNVGPTPVRAKAVEDALGKGAKPEEAAQHASDGLNPAGDLRASPEYKKHLARVLTRRAIEQAQ